jgi:hypothetical protein
VPEHAGSSLLEALGSQPARLSLSPRVQLHQPLSLQFAQRLDQLDGCTEGSREEAEYMAIAEAIEYRRWPDGKVAGGKANLALWFAREGTAVGNRLRYVRHREQSPIPGFLPISPRV